MNPNTFPTKGNLILAKNSLALAKQGYVLMDKKRNIIKVAIGLKASTISRCLFIWKKPMSHSGIKYNAADQDWKSDDGILEKSKGQSNL